MNCLFYPTSFLAEHSVKAEVFRIGQKKWLACKHQLWGTLSVNLDQSIWAFVSLLVYDMEKGDYLIVYKCVCAGGGGTVWERMRKYLSGIQ